MPFGFADYFSFAYNPACTVFNMCLASVSISRKENTRRIKHL